MNKSSFFIIGQHAVVEALKNPKRKVLRVFLTEESKKNIHRKSPKKNLLEDVKVYFKTKKELDKYSTKENLLHQGYVAEIEHFEKPILKDFIKEKKDITLVCLDSVTDPRNIGSLVRSAASFNIDGVILKERNFPSDSKLMYKAASGAMEYMPIFEVSNINSTLKNLKDKNFWVYGFDGNGDKKFTDIENCDELLFIKKAIDDTFVNNRWIYIKKVLIRNNTHIIYLDDLITYLILGIIIGGRLGYVLFYNLNYYSNNLIDILKIWQGGMSFHGGLIGVIVASIWFSKKNDQDPFIYLDIVSLVAPVGIFFGRIANFINSELYGFESNLPWAVKFIQIDNLYRHPSQLYEALFEGLILFLILLYLKKKNFAKNPGFISGLFLFIYSIFRFCIEFVRVPDEQLGYLVLGLTMGQIISFIFLIIGIYLIIKKYEIKKVS